MNRIVVLCFAQVIFTLSILSAGDIEFREQELKTQLTVGYAVRLLDMNGDDRQDIVVVDSKRIIWLENPNWDEHTLTTRDAATDNVCFAPSDINGDGQLDFAVGSDWQFNNTASGGSIGWITSGKKPDAEWSYHHIGDEPTVHRMQFIDLDGDSRDELIVVPLKGRDTTGPKFAENGVQILSYKVPKDPVKGPWKADVLNDQLHVTHNFCPADINRDGQTDLLVVGFEGVVLLERNKDGTWQSTRIGAGDQEGPSNWGASEIKTGRLANGDDYIATIEPWHGDKVVVYTRPEQSRISGHVWLWNRQVLDADLKWGHAVSCANLDGDDDQELIIGVRDDKSDTARRGLRIYDPQDKTGQKWKRSVIDPGSVAIEDLAAGDLNGDGRTDIVAVGRQTHNVKIYWNETK